MADDVGKKLDTLISIMRIAHKDAIAAARESIRSEKGNAEILDAAPDWVAAGQLQSTVNQKTKQSIPTVKRRIAALVDQGALEKQGSGGNVSYRSTGLV
jgi:predicted HTH transcriptional regulator